MWGRESQVLGLRVSGFQVSGFGVSGFGFGFGFGFRVRVRVRVSGSRPRGVLGVMGRGRDNSVGNDPGARTAIGPVPPRMFQSPMVIPRPSGWGPTAADIRASGVDGPRGRGMRARDRGSWGVGRGRIKPTYNERIVTYSRSMSKLWDMEGIIFYYVGKKKPGPGRGCRTPTTVRRREDIEGATTYPRPATRRVAGGVIDPRDRTRERTTQGHLLVPIDGPRESRGSPSTCRGRGVLSGPFRHVRATLPGRT